TRRTRAAARRREGAESQETARRALADAAERGCDLVLPVDVVCADRFAADAAVRTVAADAFRDVCMGLDIGLDTSAGYAERLRGARTIFWNGPMGVFELEPFARGTLAVAGAVAASDAVSVVGGGGSLSAVNVRGVADRITHVSTGGGAALELVEGKTLPGVA